MKNLLAGATTALLVVPGLVLGLLLGLPGTAHAGPDDPSFSVSSTSYSGQPSTYSVQVINNLEFTTLTATLSNGGRSMKMSCSAAGAIHGLGPWRCSLGGKRLVPGSLSVTARASGSGGKSKAVTRSGSVSSRFGITGKSSPAEGQGFTVRGRYDHISGRNDFRVRARVTGNGGVVAGQSGTSCKASGGSFTCNLRSAAGFGSRYTVTVTESGPITRSDSTTVSVATTAAPSAPSFSGPATYRVDKQPRSVTGSAGRAGLVVQVKVDSQDFSSPTSTCTSSGSGFFSCALPELSQGTHTIAARAFDPGEPTKISSVSVRTTTLTAKPTKKPTKKPTVQPTPTATPTEEPITLPEVESPPAKTPTAAVSGPFTSLSGTSSQLLLLLALGLALVTLARPGTVAVATGRDSATFYDDEAAEEGRELALQRGVGIGDNSPTWRAFGYEATDYWSRTMPGLLNRHSPFLARLVLDGQDLRAIFGTLWWLAPIGGLVFGIGAASDTAGTATLPSLGIVIGVLVLASFDALAGFVATLVFGLLVVGDVLSDKHGALTVLALGFLWTSLPLVANALRPFRRPGRLTLEYTWDRLADLVIAALVAGWVAYLIADTMDLFAGTSTEVSDNAALVGLVAVGAMAARVLVAHLVDVWWPERLRQTEIQEDLPEPSTLALLGGLVVRVAVFGFLGHAFLGSCWQLWAGLVLFALPDLLRLARDAGGLDVHLPVPLPRGITAIFVVVVACILLITVFVSGADDERTALRFAFLAAALAPAVLGSANVFRSEKKELTGSTWDLQLAGAGIVLTTLILAVRGWNF